MVEAAGKLQALENELASATAACEREQSEHAQASRSKAEFEHDRRVAEQTKVATTRIDKKRQAEAAAAAEAEEERARREALHATLTGPHGHGRKLQKHPKAIVGWLKPGSGVRGGAGGATGGATGGAGGSGGVSGAATDEMTVVDLTGDEAQFSKENQRARELADFGRVREQEQAQHVKAARAGGGLLLG
jgi:hypothetical protein